MQGAGSFCCVCLPVYGRADVIIHGKADVNMKEWYIWLALAAIWIPPAAVNYAQGKQAGFIANIVQIVLFSLLGVAQLVCEKHGEKGKKAFKYISIGAVAFCVAYLCAAVAIALR